MTQQEKNKNLVLEAFDAAFNKRDPEAYERYWAPDYIQHSAHIKPGRDGLREIIASTPANMKYEHGLVMAEADFVMIPSLKSMQLSSPILMFIKKSSLWFLKIRLLPKGRKLRPLRNKLNQLIQK